MPYHSEQQKTERQYMIGITIGMILLTAWGATIWYIVANAIF